MTVALPMAGVQKYFCTMSMAFVDGVESCPVPQKDCCKKEHQPVKPDCLVSAKILPNADQSAPVHLPAADGEWTVIPVAMANLIPVVIPDNVFPEKERGPPDGLALFLEQERLLI